MMATCAKDPKEQRPRRLGSHYRQRGGVSLFVRGLVFCVMALSGLNLRAQSPDPAPATQKPPLPGAILMPWRSLGIEPEILARSRLALKSARESLATQWLQQKQSLTAYLQGAVPLVARPQSDDIQVGAIPSGKPPLVAEPVWCRFADHNALFLTLADARSNVLLAAPHQVFSQTDWATALKKNTLAETLNATLRALLPRAIQEADSRSVGLDDRTALHVGFSLARETTVNGSSQCLNLLLASRLAANINVARPIGGEPLGLVRNLVNVAAVDKLLHPNRTLIVWWEPEQVQHFPLRYTLHRSLGESVLGGHIAGSDIAHYELPLKPDGTIGLNIDPRLADFLSQEGKALTLADWPQVAKVYGAWVYLDRGRAYGLKMNDRLMSADGQPIKGHVVGFFGPEMGLKSPRGFAISEGAIVFIRQGQKLTRPGQTFVFDSQSFPAPLPLTH